MDGIDLEGFLEGLEEPPPPVSLRPLLTRDANKIAEARAKLAELSREELFSRLLRRKVSIDAANEMWREIKPRARVEYWLLNQECTRRGIPPILRNLPYPNDDDKRQIADAVAIDMEWIAATYPKHHIPQPSWRPILKPTTLHDKSFWIGSQHLRFGLHLIARRLGLSETQQRELYFVKRLGLSNEAERLEAQREEARARLASAYYGRDGRYRTGDGKATVARRLDVWHVGHLAGWKPTQTARLYEAKTGKKLTRQMAANIIAQIKRDLPECGKKSGQVKSKKS